MENMKNKQDCCLNDLRGGNCIRDNERAIQTTPIL